MIFYNVQYRWIQYDEFYSELIVLRIWESFVEKTMRSIGYKVEWFINAFVAAKTLRGVLMK